MICGVKRGSCIDVTCDLHGWCHDGCGQRTRITDSTHTSRDFVGGAPMAYVLGHNPTARANIRLGCTSHTVPAAKVMPLLRWGVQRYGSRAKMSIVMGRERKFLDNLGRYPRVRAETARRLAEFVLIHRQGTSAFFDEVTERRLPSEAERTSTRREHEAKERARYREAS